MLSGNSKTGKYLVLHKTAMLPPAPEFGQSTFTAATVTKVKTQSLKLIEQNRHLLDDFLEEKLSIEKKVVNLNAERDLRLAKMQTDEEQTRKIAELQRQLSQTLLGIDHQIQDQRFHLDTQTINSLAECMRVKFEKENHASGADASLFNIEPLPSVLLRNSHKLQQQQY